MVRACIFDLGGTIVDKYSLIPFRSFKNAFKKHIAKSIRREKSKQNDTRRRKRQGQKKSKQNNVRREKHEQKNLNITTLFQIV